MTQVEHVTMCTLKEDATDAEKETMTQESYKLRTIDGVLNVATGPTTIPQRSQGYTHALVARFKDQAAYDAEQAHPVHHKLLAMKPMMDPKVPPIFLDFIVDEAGKL